MGKRLCLYILLSAGVSNGAKFDFFLKIEGIDAEAQECRHRDKIDLLSFDFNTPQPAASALPKRGCNVPSYLNLKLSNVVISSVAANPAEASQESISLEFGKVNFDKFPGGNDRSRLATEYSTPLTAIPAFGGTTIKGLSASSFFPSLTKTTLGFLTTQDRFIVTNPVCPTEPGTGSAVTCTEDLAVDINGQTSTATVKENMNPDGTIKGVEVSGPSGSVTIDNPVGEISGALAENTNPKVTADPVSTATGELIAGPFIDLNLGGPIHGGFGLRRFYGTALAASGISPMGFAWKHNFDPYLIVSGNLAVVVLDSGGTTSFQLNNGSYQLVFPARTAYQLVQDSTGYRYLDPAQNLIYTFAAHGRLARIEDRNGNALTVTPTPGGLPAQISDGLGRSLAFTYDSTGYLIKVQDQSGRTVSYTHDSSQRHNLLSVTDANNNTTSYSYLGSAILQAVRPLGNAPYTQTYDPVEGTVVKQTDSLGNATLLSYVDGGTPGKTVVTDPLNRSTTYNYANLIDLSSFTDAAGQSAAYTYDDRHRPLTVTDRLGNMTSVTYDAASGRIASITDAKGQTTSFTYQSQVQGEFTFYNLVRISYSDGATDTFTYDGSGNVLTATNGAGKTRKYTYNNQGQVLTATNAAGGVATFTYNSDGTLATKTDPAGNVTTYGYDNLKRPAKIQHADKTAISFTRDAVDQILSITDERGNITKLAYDANNNLQSATDALNQTAKSTYDTDDLPSTATDRLGKASKVQYDPLGSVTAITNAGGEKTTFTYDNLERLQSAADPSGKGPSFTYDAEGRLATFTDALGNTGKVTVDQVGRTTGLTSPLGEKTSIAYDSLGRVTAFTDPLSRATNFTYEQRGLPTGIAAPGGISTVLAWGDLPLLKSITDPNGNTWKTSYDVQGRLSGISDPLGQALNYTYDSRSRVSGIGSSVDSVQISYDAAGNAAQMQYSDNSSVTYTYDNDNRLTGGTGFSFARDAEGRLTASNGLKITRDLVGRIASITYASGKTVNYAYDSRGVLARISDWAGGSVLFTFDAAHHLTSLARSNGVVTLYTYDKNGRVVSITDSKGGKALASISLTRDAIGRVASANRVLPQEAAPGSSGMLAASFDAANQIAGFTYDARGRLTKGDAGSTYLWSAGSQLLSYSRADGSASFTYDALGQRISRTGSDGDASNYVLNYATVLPSVAIVQSGGSDVRYYVYTPGGALLFSIEAAGGAHHFYSFDETGNTALLSADDGSVSDTYGISPYGDVITAGASNKTDNPFTWQGQFGVMQEPGTSLFYLRFRYYDAAFGRFLSRDPLFSADPRRINRYQYAAGDPVGEVDPLGLKSTNLFALSEMEAAIEHDWSAIIDAVERGLARPAYVNAYSLVTHEFGPVPAPPPPGTHFDLHNPAELEEANRIGGFIYRNANGTDFKVHVAALTGDVFYVDEDDGLEGFGSLIFAVAGFGQ